MAPSTPRKRAKSLLKELWELQIHDIPMTTATLLEVKYLLRTSKRCVCVEIQTPRPPANVMDPEPFNIAQNAIPRFILCQLWDQKLIQSRNYQDTIALPAVLSVIDLTYSRASSSRHFSFPTQFRWHCSRTHRTHIIFAYVDIKMKTKIYSVEELLDLRNSASPDVMAAVVGRDTELNEMLRAKSRVSSRSYSYSSNSLKRGTHRKMTDDSSTTSDEVIFKGTISRRKLKSEAAQAVQSMDPSQPSQTAQPAISNHTDAKLASAHPIEPDQPMEWKYRGRSGSEVTAPEPLQAPTGINAQNNEGFQRFYKAVVSPTHVRVTAGGRIVPNTRNPVSPTAKRPKDSDVGANGIQTEPTPAAAAPKQPPPVMGMPHPMSFYYPGFHPGMPAIHPMTGMPIPMMGPGFPFPMPIPNAAAISVTPDASSSKDQAKAVDDNKDGKVTVETDAPRANIKISPPEQFDHTKPFMYNGQQWMFPMFPAPYPGFLRMPPQAFAGPHIHGAPMMMPPHPGMPPMMGPMGPMGPQPTQGTTGPPATTPTAPRQTTPQPPAKPPISSIRPSQITKRQIDGLRSNLKYHEDQLLFNKHQIDEKDMEKKIHMLQMDIERFERAYRNQVKYEEVNYPRQESVGEEAGSSGGRSSTAPSTKTSQSQSEESKESKATTATTSSQPKFRKKDRSRDAVGLNSNKSSTASYTFEDESQDGLSAAMNSERKSTLPSGAALAPVFQPRSVSAFTAPPTNGQGQAWQSANADEAITQEQLDAAEKRLMAAGTKSWNMSQQARELTDTPSQQQSPHGPENLGVPYLVGTLPRGVNPCSTHRVEYEYSRKLTDEELQARHVYWGKATHPVNQGLPKYDGKNFYHPSPVKNVTVSESHNFRRGRLPVGLPEVDYGFPASNAKEMDPFRAVTPNETFLMTQELVDGSKTPSAQSSHSFHSQSGDHSEEFEKALAETRSEETEASHSKDVSETRSADYHDVRANGTSSRLWQSMLKRGLTSSDVLPNAVSSTTAQGYLPQFSGNAAASLCPTISGTIGTPSRGSPSKDKKASNGTSTFMTQKTVENCSPAAGERLSETLLNIVGMKAPAWAN